MHSKIQGLIYNKSEEEQLQLILLKEKLPISCQRLNWIMINICSILLELAGRQQIMFPKITLDSIYISLDPNNSLPYIKSYEDLKVPSQQRYEYAKSQMHTILNQLNYENNIKDEKNLNLQEIQVKLLEKIGYKEDSATEFTNQFQGFLLIKSNIIVHEQKTVTRVDSIKTPSFILGVKEDEIIMKIYKQKQEYERREVEIIEKFTDNQLPKLYSYIRYNNILILFLKKHKISLCQLFANCMTKRKNQKNIDLDQFKYQGHLKIYQSMIKSLENLHSQNIIHRDLKPDNIMFDSINEIKNLDNLLLENLICVLIDYDRSKELICSEQQLMTNYIGNKIFRPPEGKQIIWSHSYDIWQMGLIWMLSLKEVFVCNPQQFNNNQEMKKIFDTRDINYDQFIKNVVQLQNHIKIEKYDDLYQLIQQMLDSNPNERPTVQNIKDKIELLIQL